MPPLFDASEPGWQVQSATRISWWLTSFAGALLLTGLVFYLAFRSALPVALQQFHVPPSPLAKAIGPNVFVGSFPSLVHVAAFSLLTCAFLRPSIFSAVAAGGFWAAIDIIWELGCDHPVVRSGYQLLRITSVPACTYDKWDIAASLLGAAIAVGITHLILKFHSSPPASAKE